MVRSRPAPRALSLVVALALGSMLLPGAARAVPFGPPQVDISYQQVEPELLTFDVTAVARDPDGRVFQISLCVDTGGGESCQVEVSEEDGGAIPPDVRYCVGGDYAEATTRVTFPGAGRYRAHARAVGGGCPPAGDDQVATAETEIVIVASPPFTPVPCAVEGEPTATDTGVTERTIRLAAVVGASGPGSSFEGDPALALSSVVRNVNAAGGVCGRMLELDMFDDGGDEERNRQYTRSLIEADEHFALVAMPSRGRGLAEAIKDGSVEAAGIPIVGTQARSEVEFSSRWVWPVGSPARSQARAVASHAYEQGARRFAVVWNADDPWAVAAAREYRSYVAGLEGANVAAAVPVSPARASYSAEIAALNQGCDGNCEAMFWIMEPQTALTFVAGRPQEATIEHSLSHHLFNEQFAANCGERCSGMKAWMPFHPPVGDAPPESLRYRQDVGSGSDGAISMGSYLGILTLAEAMGRTGVTLTREGLRQALNATPFESGLVGGPLDWSSSRRANRWVRGYAIVVVAGSFAGWRDDTGWVQTP